MTKLKPCPVCGFSGSKSDDDEDDLYVCQSFGRSCDGFFIACSICGCRSRDLSDTEEEAIEIWNEMCDMKDKYKEEEQR